LETIPFPTHSVLLQFLIDFAAIYVGSLFLIFENIGWSIKQDLLKLSLSTKTVYLNPVQNFMIVKFKYLATFDRLWSHWIHHFEFTKISDSSWKYKCKRI